MSDRYRLKPEKLRWTCDPAKLKLKTTEEVEDLTCAIGQNRAVKALDFGMGIPSDGYNIFVVGPPGTGRTSMTSALLNKKAATQAPSPDLCYVHNFENANAPRAISLPPGMACKLRDDLDELIEDSQREINAAFESEEYAERRDHTIKDFREARQSELEAFEKEAQQAGMILGRGPAGILVAPAKDGEVLSPQEYQELPEEERKALEEKRASLQEKLTDILRRHHREEKKARAQVKELDRDVARFAVGQLFEELQEKYRGHERVVEHLKRIQQDIADNVDELRQREDEAPMPLPIPQPVQNRYELYRINVLLTCDSEGGAAVVYEPNPTIDNLTGKVEHRTHMGALITDFTMIRPGALHRANGGYLILEADAVLRRPYAWEAVKRALKNRQIRIESLADQFRFMATVTLEPEPIPLDLKIVLVGTPWLYQLLYAYDDEFKKLFKVKSDFDTITPRTAAVMREYGCFVGAVCNREGLPHFRAEAVALIVEHSVRLAGDQTKLSTRFSEVADMVREAAYWSRTNGNSHVTADDVRKAISEHLFRSSRIEERMMEMVERDFINLDLKGAEVGQVNGLSVLQTGDYTFGRPSRISAKTYAGKSGVTQIDREAKLTGRIHDKGVLILNGFIGDRFGQDEPLSLTASLVFEQTYGMIDGDSASSAELYALLSSLSDVPVRQDIAVTGSVNQSGDVQAIGGVNEKIEGFFKTCKSRGLTGSQGVMIPKANLPNLMLDHEVIEAVQNDDFCIYAVSHVDQGMEVLTGEKMGRRRKNGTFTPGTICEKVQLRLHALADASNGGAENRKNGNGQDS